MSFYSIITRTILAATLILAIGCSDDNDGAGGALGPGNNNNQVSSLDGTWTFSSCSSTINSNSYTGATVTFGAGSSIKLINPGWQDQQGQIVDIVETGTYTASGSNLTINITSQTPQGWDAYYNFGIGSNTCTYQISGNELKVTRGSSWLAFTK